jgi:hypothetical protein
VSLAKDMTYAPAQYQLEMAQKDYFLAPIIGVEEQMIKELDPEFS